MNNWWREQELCLFVWVWNDGEFWQRFRVWDDFLIVLFSTCRQVLQEKKSEDNNLIYS